MTLFPHHFISERGVRSYMEDAYVIPDERGNFFAVFDGHGGDACAKFCAAEVKDLFFSLLEQTQNHDVFTVFESVFDALHDRLRAVCPSSGTTATMIYIADNQVYTANVGDSEALIWRDRDMIVLTKAHRAGLDPIETDKVENCGGLISGNRVNGALSVTRALGDFYFTPAVSSKPTLTSTRLRDTDRYIIIASDGLWDAIQMCEIPRIVELAEGDLAHMAACLGEKCCLSRDNYTVGIIDLNPNQNIDSTGGFTFSKQFQLDQQMALLGTAKTLKVSNANGISIWSAEIEERSEDDLL